MRARRECVVSWRGVADGLGKKEGGLGGISGGGNGYM